MMRQLVNHANPVWIWSLLVAATLCSVGLFETLGSGRYHRYANVGILVIAFIKVRLVGLDFMELRDAPRGLRVAFEVWVVAVAGVLVGLCLRG